MKGKRIAIGLAIAAISMLPQLSFADDNAAVKTIAGILVTLKHFPSADDKTALTAITNDAAVGASVKSIAKAVHDLQHKVSATDKTTLDGIASSDPTKDLADILVGINHIPSADAKAALMGMM
ncbi:MAG: hypothetical protein VB957_05710 [Pseudomonadales bacterium]|jgi:hypothetical protein